MPIFDNEIKDKGTKLSNIELPDVDKRSPIPTQINPNLGMEDLFGSNQTPTYNGVKWGEMTNIGEQRGFDRPFSGVTKATLLENQRYPMYQKDVDLENIYGLQQPWYKQLANGLAKGAITAVGTFAQGMMTIPDTINAIKTGKVSELSGGTDGAEAHIDDWVKNMEDIFPNYYTRDEREHPFRAAIPFTSGFANFLGDKIIKNLGFTAGAIGSAVAQDAAIGFVTEGVGELPLVGVQLGKLGAQIGKASLYLNKLFAGTNDLDGVLNLAKGLGKTEKQLLNVERLGQLAAARKIGSGIEYGVALYGSARTEAAVEARDGYNQVKAELIRQHKLKNLGEDPTPENLAEIDQYATNAMNVRFGINMALLTVSNAIQFDSIFKSFTKAGSKGVTSGVTRELEDLGKIGLKEGSLDVFEKKAATSLPGKIWEVIEPKIPNILSEGVYEEGGQFAAEKGTYDYYTRKYKDPKKGENQATWNSLNEIIKSTNYGLHEQFGGEEGWENMFIGGLSAMLTTAGMSRIDRMKGGGKDARLQTAINSLNQYGMTGTLGASYDNTANSMNISKEMNEAANSGNVFKYKNLKHEAFFNFVNSRLASDRHDVTVEQLNMLKDLSKEEFEKTFGMDFNASNQKTVSGYVDGLINKANDIKKTSDSINNTFKNPFKQIINPKGEDEITETVKHTVFENWKTDLSYYSSVAPEVNDRLNSIEKSVSEIHESLNNDLLSSLTSPESIKDLSKSYEEQANQLSKTITEFTSLEDKKKTNAQIKALRTQAEKINLALNTNNYDLKTFNSLLNFELNNHDTSKSDAINMTDAPKLFGYGTDINKLEGLKASASDTLDKLSSKDGFEKYFKQADDMAEEVLTPEEVVTPKTKPTEAGIPQYTTPSGKRENLDIGREYTIGKYTKSKVSKIADDRWQTVSPDGTFEIYPTKEKADEAAAELNDEFANLEKIKIVGHNADGTVKIEDKNGDIYDINTRKLSGFIKKESEQEKLQKFASALDKQQTEIEKKSGIVGTGNNETDLAAMPKEDMLKSADKLFISTTSTSEDWDNPTIKPHEVRSREFLNNVKNFSNRGNIKLILVTPNQEESLGLKGLGELSGSTDVSVSDGLVAAVYVAQVNGKTYFVDEKGKTIGEVGQPVDINKVVFSTMSKPKLTNSKGGNRFRRGEEAAALAQRNAWEAKRAQLFAAPAGSFTVYDFGVSRGIPIKNQVGGKNEKNAVGENLVPENKIETQGGLIVISTTGTLAHNGENFNIPKGRPMLQYGDTFQFLDNAVFNNDQAKTIFEAIKVLSEDITKKAAEGKTIEFNRLYSDYIQKMLYWRKSSNTTNNQIYLDTTNMDLYLGGKKYAFTDIAGNEKAIVDQLKQTYHSVNNEAVKDLAEPFVELYFEDGYLKEREWANYQTYLLSSTYPNGKKRADSDVPLTTSVAKPTAAMPYNYKQKYATLQGMELPVQAVAPVVVVALAPKATVKKIGEHTIDGKTENKIALKDPLGETSFTASVDAEGKVTAEVTLSPAQQAVASDPTKVAPYINALKQGGKYDSTDSDEKSLAKFMAINVAAKLEAIEKAEAPVAPVVPVTPITTDLYKKSAINTFPISKLGFIPRAVAEKAYAEYSKRHGTSQSLNALATRGGFGVSEMDDLYPNWRDEVVTLNAPAPIVQQTKPTTTYTDLLAEAIPLFDWKKLGTDPNSLTAKASALADRMLADTNLMSNLSPEERNKPFIMSGLSGSRGELRSALEFLAKEETKSTTPVASAPAVSDIEKRRNALPELQASNTRTPATKAILDYFAETVGIPKFTEDLSKGTYLKWLQDDSDLGDRVSHLLEHPRRAFDEITKYAENLKLYLEGKSRGVNIYEEAAIQKKKEALIKERDEEIRKVHFPKTFGPVGFAYGTTFYTLEDLATGVHGEESAESYKKLEDTLRDESKSLDDRVVNFDEVKSKLGMIWGTLEMQDKDIAAEFHHIYNAWGKENYGSKWGDISGTEFGLSMSKFILKYWSYETLAGKETRPLYEFLKDPRKGIIDEYNKKLAELEGNKAPVSTDAKADIERRRQEQLKRMTYDELSDELKGYNHRLINIKDNIGNSFRIIGTDENELIIDYIKPDGKHSNFSIPVSDALIKKYENTEWSENDINAKYNAELLALEGGKPKDFSKTTPPDEAEYRRVGGVNGSRITDAEIQLFKEYVAKNAPGIPYEILEQIVTTHDGEKAWGVFENGVAKFYKGAIKGTEYHELFEGIWKAFVSSEDQQAILDEFKAKKGTFTDRQSGRKIDYADATDRQAKERIADDFADFRVGKLPAKTIGEKILKFFRDIIQFVKEFVNKPSKKTELFKAIDTGKFKESVMPESVKNDFDEYRAVEGLTEQQTNEFVQDITARTFQIIFGNNLSLYDIEKMTAPEIFGQIKDKYDIEGKSELLGEQSWKDLIKKTKEFLRTFKVEFDDEQQVSINDENVNKNDYVPEGFTTDWKKTSPFPIKLLLGTLIETAPTNQENGSSFTLPKPKWSPLIVGFKLLNFSRAFATVLDKFANTSKVTDVVDKLIDLAKYDSNYVRLFTRLGGNRENAVITFSDFKKEDWRLFINFYQTFTKQKPDALIQYKKGSEVYTAPANLFTAIKEKQTGWVENMKELAKDKDSLIFKNKSTKTYQVKDEIKDVEINTSQKMVSFLNKLGIIFPMEVYSKLKPIQQNKFANSVGAIRSYLGKEQDLITLTGDTLGINGQLSILAELLVKVTNPNQDPTYFNVENKRTNSFSENNAPSLFENAFASSETLDQLLEERPELTDLFSAHSVILKKGGLFYDKNGNKIKALKVSYIQGTNDIDDNKGITTSKLSKGDRYTQELNQNLNGNYYVLIPADGSTEWMMNMGNHISFADVSTDRAAAKVNEIFKGYLKDDIALALDAKNREKNRNLGDRGSELRFLKDILSEKMLNGINDLISKEASEEEFDDYINKNIGDFNKSVQDYINNYTNQSFDLLKEKKQISEIGKDKFSYGGLDDVFTKKQKLNKFKLSEQSARSVIKFADINYIINNIEYHKILFGDPLQFAIKEKNGKTILDETKRVKSFLSPRRTTFDTVEYNTFLNQTFNKVGEIELSSTDPGYHLHKAYANTVTFSDVDVVGSLASLIPAYAETNEADAVSFIMDGTYREVKLKNSQWDDNAEDWHQWQLAYTRLALEKKKVYAYTNDALRAADTKLISTPSPKYTIEILKPIVSGNKFGKSQFDLVLDKFSQMPIYYSMIEGHAFEKFYIKMFKENRDYAIMLSGRKVGAEELHDLYVDGEFNEAPFNNNIQVPWKAYGIQVENSYSGPKETTRGSQITKVSSMDLFENGIAVSPEVEQEYRHNVKMLDLLHENGYDSLLEKLGIRDLGTSFELVNKKAVSETLEYEMLRRELSDNAKDTVQLDKGGQFRIPFEASPAYVQIRDILYSMVDKSIRSPKMNGGGYVQAPVTLWESSKVGRKVVEVNGKKVLTDSSLKFYTKNEPWCEIMLPAWFKNKLNKNGRFKTDEDILNYLNKTEEGREILSGVGFRIPTQSLSSTEVFRVKGFLNESFGNTVVVPSEITVKAGSDFDIDKLNMYLKSIYIDKNGDIRLVRYKGDVAASNEFYGKVFDDKLAGRIAKKDEILEALQIANYGLDDPKGLVDKYANTLDVLISGLGDVNDTAEIEEGIIKELEKLGDKNFQEGLRIKFQKEMYKRSLENEYYASLGRLIAAPENFERLISPVDDAGLQKISEELDKLKGDDESKIKNRMLNRNFLTALRHAFVSGKRWVGIAAVNITGHSLTQKGDVHLDPSRFALVPENDQKFLGNGEMILTHNTTKINGQEYISLSGVTDGDGKKHISDSLSGAGTSIVDVAKDPFFMKIIGSDLAIGPFMFLIRVGVPLRQLSLFMNQPIVTEYLNYLDSEGSKTLYNDRKIRDILGKFPTTTAAYSAAKINLGQLGENIKEYSVDKKFNNDADNATQHLILDEFLKYAKMSDYSFKMTQATNYDTTSFRSGDALYKKQLRTQKALDTNIFAGIDALLNDTFIGKQADFLDGATEGIGEILKLDNAEFSEITNEVLTSYANNEYMSADNFDMIGNKLKASFLDYLIQTNSTLANQINKLLVNVGTSVATRLANAQKAHPEIKILNDLSIVTSNREDGAKSIKLIANLKSAYDENLYTGMMRELRDTPGMRDFYNDIVKLAILQGTYQSSISIKNIIPIEDYSAIVKPIIDSIQPSGDTTAFVSTRSFQKNNWKDDKIVPTFLPKFFSDIDAPPIAEQLNSFGDHIADIYQYWAPAFPSIKAMGIKSSDRKVLLLSERYNSFNLKDDVIKVPRVVTDPYSGERVDMRNGQTITNFDYAIKKQKGDNTLNDFYGYAKVKLIDGSPLLHVDKKGGVHHVYKMINLLGDGRFASEYYTDNRMSILDNGTVKINEEIPNNVLIEYYGGEPVVSEQTDLGRQFEIEPGYGLNTANFESPEGLDKALAKEAQLKNFATVDSVKSKGTFRDKPIEFVNKIETTKDVPVAMQNNRTTGVIKIDEKLMQQKFDEKAWTNPATQSDNSKAEALPANTFKTFNEFLTFALIHEVKHDSILQNDAEKESKGAYETRINNAAIADLRENYKQSTLAADENNLEGAEDPNSCGQ